ncbi:nitroreductase family protein [uncultured Sanguibacteroides sp.]|uniref:nitroreductase family protein n=1 Tax=uncultured Sanguibacteroides sp. TaxID=1635151 RepID=UPI0025D6B822|nr:nitroreductase family protein [uncultured Sanguibacteroides sp.]
MLKELLLKNRSYRRFYQEVRITPEELKSLVELTRYCASGRNAQPLKYRMVTDENECDRVFHTLAWAGYLTDWVGPEEGERPSAYLIQLLDTSIVENCLCDDGIQAQTILLGAVEKGYGGCIIKAFKNDSLRAILQLPDHLKIMYVIALGKPKETVVLEEMWGEDYKYWRESDGSHHVPKRAVQDLLV